MNPSGSSFVSLDPCSLGSGTNYEILSACIQPRPIAFVSTLSSDGLPNLAPFSFFMPGGASPPSLAFSVTLLPEGCKKDTLCNIEETGEFVVNLVTMEMAQGMNATSFHFPRGESEWRAAGFNSLSSEVVRPLRVANSPAQFECRCHQIVAHGHESGSAVYVIGEIVWIHLLESLWSGGRVSELLTIARLGGPQYLDLASNSRFQMERP